MTHVAFLWGGATPAPNPAQFTPRDIRWWAQYAKQLQISDVARAELGQSARNIISLLPDPLHWGTSPRPVRGLVVGAVQSGKTASMISVAAVALDQGFRIIVVLAGGKDDLRQQTAKRFNTQLLLQADPIPGTILFTMNQTDRPLGGFGLPYAHDAHQYGPLRIKVSQALKTVQPVVLVIKKHPSSLRDARAQLEAAYRQFGAENVPTLVLDDECDDASVESAETTIPTAIADLWRFEARPPCAYIGYTATAAANLLQSASNELFPADFAYLLRYAGDSSDALQFYEPVPNSWYSGGKTYYNDFGDQFSSDENYLIVPKVELGHLILPSESNPSLLDAVRSFIVSGAFRLALQPGYSFDDIDNLPAPHSMIVQTTASMADHFSWAEGIRKAFGGVLGGDQAITFPPDRLSAEISADPTEWRKWYVDFQATRERLVTLRPRSGLQLQPTWDEVAKQIPSFLTKLTMKVLNSDPSATGILDYSVTTDASGVKHPPSDLFTLVVGGARLSRGLTIEGLSTTYFTRWNPNPTEDTVLQLCRWYGYRGSHLEFCRVFTTQFIAEQLRGMNDNDMSLRYQLSVLMTERIPPRKAAVVLSANARALPTGKIGEGTVRDIAFSPYENVFRRVECGSFASTNEITALQLVDKIKARGGALTRTASGNVRGIVSREWCALEVAEFLDSLAYTGHNPNNEGNPAREYYRKADPTRLAGVGRSFADDPYQVAAYLREWAQDEKAKDSIPNFNVGVVFGGIDSEVLPFDFPLLNREINANCEMTSSWTGRSTYWRGDAFFDAPHPDQIITGSSLRKKGSNGLLLLHIVHKSATGRAGRGLQREYHTPTFGIVIPDGGPAYRRVVVDRT